MHILFVTYEFVTEKELCGGLGHYIANISEILSKRGHRVTILMISNHNETFQWKNHVNVIVFSHNAFVSRKSRIGKYADYLTKSNTSWWLNRSLEINLRIREMNRIDPIDIVHYCGDDMSVWYRPRQIPCVVRLSSFGPWYDLAGRPGSDMNDTSWLDTWESRFFLHSYTKADAIYGPSRIVAEIVKKKLKKEIKVMESPCVVDEHGAGNADADEFHGKTYLLFFGRICLLKGIGVIREMIHDVLEENPQVLFVFAGREIDKSLLPAVKRAAGEYCDRVICLGEIKDPERMSSIVRHAYACVLPSRADNLPNSCIEAMGLGKVVIGTYGASFEQLIRHKESGLLVKRDSPGALKKAIRYAMEMTDQERLEMGRRAKERISCMHPDVVYRQLLSFYQKVIESKQKR